MTFIKQPEAQVPGVFHKQIGEITVTAVSDGGMQFPFWPYYELGEETGRSILEAQFEMSPPYLNTNCFLININGRITLIDTGLGMGVGVVMKNIIAAGVEPQAVETVLLTHLHPDHAGGLVLQDGSKAFPNAEIVVSQTEFEYWMNDRNMKDPADINERGNFHWAQAALAPYEGRIRTFTPEETEPVTGIQAIEAPGHTPGHTVFLIESQGDKLLIWGDILHNAAIQLLRPEEKLAMDVWPEAAIATRKRILDYAAENRLLVTGMHLGFPGFGHIRKEDDHYVHVPEFWKPVL